MADLTIDEALLAMIAGELEQAAAGLELGAEVTRPRDLDLGSDAVRAVLDAVTTEARARSEAAVASTSALVGLPRAVVDDVTRVDRVLAAGAEAP